MYKFEDTQVNTRGEPENGFLAEAMSVDGYFLEDLITGYRTLTTSGRELFARTPSTQEISGFDGAVLLDTHNATRQIKVTYQLEAKTSQEFRYKFNRLNQILSSSNLKLSFRDEPEYEWNAFLSGLGTFKEGVNRGVSDLTFTCVDPFKYQKQITEYSGKGKINIISSEFYAAAPEYIKLKISSSATEISIKTDNYKIGLTYDFPTNSTIEIKPNADEQLVLNGVPTPEILDFESDLENFKVTNGDILTASNTNFDLTLGVRWREL